MLTNNTKKIALATIIIAIVSLNTIAQNTIRQFSQVYSENLHGGTTIFGNTILHIVENNQVNLTKMNESGNSNNGIGGIGFSHYGNDNSNMQFVDIDGSSATQNSSSADLILPAGTNTIKFARLYWGGKINSSVITSSPDTLRKIKIRKGNAGNYFNAITPVTNVDQFSISSTEKVYQSFVDITSFVNGNGSGTYTVADIPVTPGASATGGKYGGWVIVVAYENVDQPYNSIRIYDGYAQVYNSGSPTNLSINLTGLNVPATPLTADEATMGTMSWEGDANLGASASNPAGDYIKINNVAVSNTTNPVANFWNGTITKNGSFVNTKNPNYTNQMGIDIDEVNVGNGYNIAPNATSVNVQFGTEADQYFPSLFTFCIRVKDPMVTLTKTVQDASQNGFVECGEELTYTLTGSNMGSGASQNTFVVDTLPSNVTFVQGSLMVVNCPGVSSGSKTDAADGDQAFVGTANGKTYVKFFIGNGASGTSGGTLQACPNSSYTVRFKVKAGIIPGSIVNTARVFCNSGNGDTFTDDGTAVIGEVGAPTPVKFRSFTASLLGNGYAQLKWTTEAEMNNDHFEIERSADGVNYNNRGSMKGNGSSSAIHNYSYNDELNTNAAIIYYRLKIFDTDGKYSYSKVIALRLSGNVSVEDFNVYPNPFITDIKVAINAAADANASFRIISFDGKEVIRRNADVQKGENVIVLNNFGTLPKGNYILEVSTGNDKIIKKIVKN